ncbi:MAG: 30S ribosomal protein S16 [Thermodesulfobacteriota bacterium]
MGVKIRLARYGGKKKPFYRIVVTDSRSPRDGKFIEVVGTYDPGQNPVKVELKNEKIVGWLNKGALATETVKTLLKKAGLKSTVAKAA